MNTFLSSQNRIARVLLGHFLAIQVVLSPIVDRNGLSDNAQYPSRYHPGWLASIHNKIPDHLRRYREWPKVINDGVIHELQRKGKRLVGLEVPRKNEVWSRISF